MKYFRVFFVFILFGCNRAASGRAGPSDTAALPALSVSSCLTQQGAYPVGAVVKLSCLLTNSSSDTVTIDSVEAGVNDMSVQGALFYQSHLVSALRLAPGQAFPIDSLPVWTIPTGTKLDAYGLYLSYWSKGKRSEPVYQTFFRVTDPQTLTTYQIGRHSFRGLDIFTLDGGMSAEYAVEKSLENLAPGISHSWYPNNLGDGPRPVFATPEFLQKAVNRTVDSYNEILGAKTIFNTVMISTGIPSIPYLSNTLKAPVLPLHFLTSVNSEKEIQSIMDYSNHHGLPCYATLGYDLSVSPAVAWIKLLDLPQAYLQFLRQHKVQNVVIVGESISSGGETSARQVLNKTHGPYQPGSIYILYPGNTADDSATLSARIVDLKQVDLTPGFTTISDWESGIIPAQVNNFAHTIKDSIGISVYSVTSPNLDDMYALATYMTVAYFQKNRLTVTGVSINPYLLSHPAYESSKGFIPFNYWQGNVASGTVARLISTTRTAVADFFPGTNFNQLNFWVNSSNNFGGNSAAVRLLQSLRARGLQRLIRNDYRLDEVWDPTDGMTTVCEKIATALSRDSSADEYREWVRRQAPLTIREMTGVIQHFLTIQFQQR